MYFDMLSLDKWAAVLTDWYWSSSMRKYRLGVCPVAGRPLVRFSSSITGLYVHPSILSIFAFYGWTENKGKVE